MWKFKISDNCPMSLTKRSVWYIHCFAVTHCEMTSPSPDPALEASIRRSYSVTVCYARLHAVTSYRDNKISRLIPLLTLNQLGGFFLHFSNVSHVSTKILSTGRLPFCKHATKLHSHTRVRIAHTQMKKLVMCGQHREGVMFIAKSQIQVLGPGT